MRYLSINDLLRQGPKSTDSIWVLNTADQSLIGTAGEVVIAVAKASGRGDPDLIKIPQTWLPQEVTKIIPRKRLLQSSEFMKALNNNLVAIISEDDAAKLLRQIGSKEEQARLLAIQKHIRETGGARTVTDGMKAANGSIARADGLVDDEDEDDSGRNQTTVTRGRDKDVSVAVLAAEGVEDDEPGISPQFKMWVDRLNTGTDIAARNAVKSKGSFKKLELGFLARELNKSFVATHKMVSANLHKK